MSMVVIPLNPTFLIGVCGVLATFASVDYLGKKIYPLSPYGGLPDEQRPSQGDFFPHTRGELPLICRSAYESFSSAKKIQLTALFILSSLLIGSAIGYGIFLGTWFFNISSIPLFGAKTTALFFAIVGCIRSVDIDPLVSPTLWYAKRYPSPPSQESLLPHYTLYSPAPVNVLGMIHQAPEVLLPPPPPALPDPVNADEGISVDL